MNNLLSRSKLFCKRNGSTILTCIGGAGVVATTVLAVKATPKAIKLLEKAEEEKGEKLTKTEIVKVAGPVYIPTILSGASTIACIFGANILNKRKQASLMSAYALLDNSYKEYRGMVSELYGEEAEERIKSELAKDKYDEDFFENHILAKSKIVDASVSLRHRSVHCLISLPIIFLRRILRRSRRRCPRRPRGPQAHQVTALRPLCRYSTDRETLRPR